MRHTLEDFLNTFECRYVTLIIGEHTINIDIEKEGSNFIIRHFAKVRFDFVSFNDIELILND